MKRIFLTLVVLLLATQANAAILVFSPNGAYTTKTTLSAAATAADAAGKTVVVTSALSAVQSNISSATVHAWPADRALKVEKGGSINPTTKFTGLTSVTPEMFGSSGDVTTDTLAFNRCVTAITSKGKIITDKSKTYSINSTVPIGTKNIEITGGGTIETFIPTSGTFGTDSLFSVSGGTLIIEGMNFTTATSSVGGVASALIPSTGIFKNNTVTNYRSGFLNYWNNSIFDGNTISCLPASILGSYAIHLPGSGNTVTNNKITGGRHHVYISGGGLPDTTDPVTNNIVTGNTFTNAGYGAVSLYAVSPQGDVANNIISNNTVINPVSNFGIALTQACSFNTIFGNTVMFDNGAVVAGIGTVEAGILINGQGVSGYGNQPHDNTITGNIIVSTVYIDPTLPDNYQRGLNIEVLNGYRNTITNNVIEQPISTVVTQAGIRLDSQITPADFGNVVSGNTFKFCGIYNLLVDTTQITGNTIQNHTSQPPIYVDAGGSATVLWNSLSGYAQTLLTINSTSPTVGFNNLFFTGNTGATKITTFTNGYIGQVITVYFNDNNTTLADTRVDGTGYFYLKGGINKTYSTYSIVDFVKIDSIHWVEK